MWIPYHFLWWGRLLTKYLIILVIFTSYFLCWFYWKTLEEIGIQWCFCCGLVFQGEFMVVPSLCERNGNWKHLLTSNPSCGEKGGKGWLKLHGWEPSGNYFISGCVQLYSIPHILLQSCVFQLKTMKGWQVLVYF